MFLLFSLFLALGLWQVERASEKSQLKKLLAERKGQSAAYFSWELLTKPSESLSQMPITLSGRFLFENQALLSNRVRNGKVGSDVITPLILSDGSGAVLVNRGWIPSTYTEENFDPTTQALSELTFTGKVQVPQGTPVAFSLPSLEGPWPLKLSTANMKVLAEEFSTLLEAPVFPYLVRINSNQPGAFEVNWPEVKIRSVGHVGYALQWFGMAAITLIIYIFRSSNLSEVLTGRVDNLKR